MVNKRITTVISGGQTGVDRAALRAARDAGLRTGGWCPPGRAADDGAVPSEFPLRETPVDRSAMAIDVPRSLRTEWNVRDADATLVLVPRTLTNDAGTNLTLRFAAEYGRPSLVCDPADENADVMVTNWLQANAVETLNVAGPSEATAPGIGDLAYELLVRVLDARTLA